MTFEATLYDGVVALPRAVTCSADGEGIAIGGEDGNVEWVGGALLQRCSSPPHELRLARSDRPGWRLSVPAAAAGEIAHLLRSEERYGRWIDRVGILPAVLVLASLTAAVLAVGYLAPHWIAPHVPAAWERNFGDAIVGDFGDLRCRDADGQRALEALVERLEPGSTRGPEAIRIAAIDVDMFNAAALPGGRIVVFKTAVTETDDIDALAGIIAHEIAHVRRRHVTEALIRELGIGALIGLFAGDIGANARQLVSLSYSRRHETEADSDAIAMLRRAGISTRPTAELFERLARDERDGTFYAAEFLDSHPLSASRARRFAAAEDPGRPTRPALVEAQADALFNICWTGPRPPADR